MAVPTLRADTFPSMDTEATAASEVVQNTVLSAVFVRATVAVRVSAAFKGRIRELVFSETPVALMPPTEAVVRR